MVANFYWIIFPREIDGYQHIRSWDATGAAR
jgi:hypothetical protein